MKFSLKIILLLTTFLMSCITNAWDVDINDRTVRMTGVYGSKQGFLTLNEGAHENCKIEHLYFDIDSEKGQAIYSTLMVAYVSKQKIRVGYNFGDTTPGKCILDLVALR